VAAPVPADRVSLRGASAAFAAAAAAPFDDRKVEEVRQAIAEGRFPVDARRVADQLIAESRELFGLPSAAR
jgi:negative regulator of flagellin synthesis FlgM